ncbi:MAG: ABC transporter ATP-binding protein [Nitriliruptorales bacterium]|nr:ABC transporter ATP-binding protein [Nitriliruptorales bacterium]
MAGGGAPVDVAKELTCTAVAVRRGGALVLQEVDLHVPAGATTTLTGPSGVGKTTLLRAIAGLDAIASGSVQLGGRDLQGVPAHERQIAYVFQRPRLLPHLPVIANVAFPLRMQGVASDERRQRAASLLDEVGLSGFGDRATRGLSGGEAQRVALARALVGQPALLLLDEPLASIDPDLRRSLRELILRLLDERRTTALYVTHDQSEAAELGDRTAVLLDGTVAQAGPPEELFERPANLAVARFLGATNELPGTVQDGALMLAGATVPVSAPDGPATFVIRPQHVHLDPASDLRGVITERRYLGSRDRVVLAIGDVRVEAELETGTAPREGAEVGIRLPPEHLWRLPDRTTSTGSSATVGQAAR